MIVLKEAHVAEIISALKAREQAIIKEAGEEARGGRWSVSAREAHDRNHQALVGFIEERDRHPDTETIVFRWSRNHGDCYECGLPAAFQLVDDGLDEAERPERGPESLRCSVCAAGAAADGESIEWINNPYISRDDDSQRQGYKAALDSLPKED